MINSFTGKQLVVLGLIVFSSLTQANGFDHQHSSWNALLQNHVTWIRGGVASEMDYAGIRNDGQQFEQYLSALSEISEEQYQGWNDDQKLAFLINAYNAFTVDLILTEYPDLDSIKDLGGLPGAGGYGLYPGAAGQPAHHGGKPVHVGQRAQPLQQG